MAEKKEHVDTTVDMTIYAVPPSQRIYKFFDMYGLWFCALVVISTPLTGAYAIFTGNIWLAIAVLVVALGVGFIPHVIMGSFTQKFGVTDYVALRRSFGIRGSNIGSIANIMQLIGWNALCFLIAAQAANGVVSALGLPSSLIFWVFLQAVIVYLIVMKGIIGIKYMERVGAFALLALGILIMYTLATGPFDWGALLAANPEPTLSYVMWFEIVLAYAFSYTAIVGDFNRFAESRGGKGGATLGLWTGAMTAGILFLLIGAFSGLATGEADPSVFIAEHMVPAVAIAGIILLLIGVITTNAICLYSALTSTLNIFPRESMWAGKKKHIALIIFSIPMVALAFTEILDVYLYFVFNFIGITFGTLFAILIADFILYSWRGRKVEGWKFDLDAAFVRNPRYWFARGFNWRGIVTFAIGFGLNQYMSLSGLTFGPLGILIPIMVISGLIYVGFNRAFPPSDLKRV